MGTRGAFPRGIKRSLLRDPAVSDYRCGLRARRAVLEIRVCHRV